MSSTDTCNHAGEWGWKATVERKSHSPVLVVSKLQSNCLPSNHSKPQIILGSDAEATVTTENVSSLLKQAGSTQPQIVEQSGARVSVGITSVCDCDGINPPGKLAEIIFKDGRIAIYFEQDGIGNCIVRVEAGKLANGMVDLGINPDKSSKFSTARGKLRVEVLFQYDASIDGFSLQSWCVLDSVSDATVTANDYCWNGTPAQPGSQLVEMLRVCKELKIRTTNAAANETRVILSPYIDFGRGGGPLWH